MIKNSISVLSLFGGIEGGMMALDSLGITAYEYLSSEIDPYPIQNTKHNYPEIIHIGDVTDVKYNTQKGTSSEGCIHSWEVCIETEINLLIAGSPCQDVSNAGNQKGLASTYEEYLERKEAGTATRSDLFWEFIRILGETKPSYFMLENVKMKKEYMDIFNKAVGFEGDLINAALLSPQNRKRVYWCGKLNEDGTYSKVSIPQPEDAGMKLKDILEDIPFDAMDKKGNPIWKPVPEKYIPIIKERELIKDKAYAITATYAGACLDNYLLKGQRTLVIGQWRRTNIRIHADQEKCPTLTANIGTGGNNVPFVTSQYMWRPLTVRECARCQGVPETYEFVTSKSRSYKCIGNGWEVRTVAHIFKHLLGALKSQETKIKNGTYMNRIKLYNAYSRTKSGKRIDLGGQFFRSGTEANFARYLKYIKLDYEFEKKEFFFEGIKKGCRFYLVDFYIPSKDIYYEVKGWLDKTSITKFKRMKKYHPIEFKKLYIVKQSLREADMKEFIKIGFTISQIIDFKQIEQLKGIIPNWE